MLNCEGISSRPGLRRCGRASCGSVAPAGKVYTHKRITLPLLAPPTRRRRSCCVHASASASSHGATLHSTECLAHSRLPVRSGCALGIGGRGEKGGEEDPDLRHARQRQRTGLSHQLSASASARIQDGTSVRNRKRLGLVSVGPPAASDQDEGADWQWATRRELREGRGKAAAIKRKHRRTGTSTGLPRAAALVSWESSQPGSSTSKGPGATAKRLDSGIARDCFRSRRQALRQSALHAVVSASAHRDALKLSLDFGPSCIGDV